MNENESLIELLNVAINEVKEEILEKELIIDDYYDKNNYFDENVDDL